MNYYIQGDAARAEQIKAAFEKLGYDISWPEGCANPDVINIGIERDGAKYVVAETSEYIKDIIKTHPDYKELELPVEPKFKAGDWIINKFRDICLITDIDLESGYYFCESNRFGNTDGDIDLTDKAFHLWTIADAKDGDVLTLNGKPFIYSSHKYGKNYCYIDEWGQLRVNFSLVFEGNCVCPTTKQEHDLLFSKMREVGYEWDADKKELRKIKPHYDIANFKPKQWVLVRQGDGCIWRLDMFSHLKEGSVCQFECVGNSMVQCIPYNDDTKHLLGTTDQCDERFINW